MGGKAMDFDLDTITRSSARGIRNRGTNNGNERKGK
jgi:hypothetical protein